MGAVRMMRTSSLSMRTFRPIAVGILGSEFEQRRLVAELYLLAGLMHMHDLVDDLEQRLVVVNLAVMHFLWLAPAAIKQNLGRCNACHRLAIRFHHDTGQHFDGRGGVRSCERGDVSAVFWHFPLVMFCKHSLQSASALANQSSRSQARAEGCLH